MKSFICLLFTCMLFLAACNKTTEDRSGTVTVTFKFVDLSNKPVEGVTVDLTTVPDSFQVSHTDTSNQQGLAVFQLSTDSVYQSLASGYSTFTCALAYPDARIFGPLTHDTTFCITVYDSIGPIQQVTFTAIGRLLDCANQPVTNGYVRFRNTQYPVHTDGTFSLHVTQCAANTPIEGFECYDAHNLRVATVAPIQWATPLQDFGDIQVCDDPPIFVTLQTSAGKFDILTGQCHAIDSFQIQFELLAFFTHSTPFGMAMSLTPNPATGMLGNYQTGYAWVSATNNSQNGYWCNGANCVPLSITITKWDGLGGVAAGSFSGFLPQFGINPLPFDGHFSGRFRVPIYH